MFKIKYCNGYSNRQVTFVEPFKRLNYCNAAYYHNTHVSDAKYNSSGHSYTFHKYALVSYETPICRIVRIVDNVTNKDSFKIYVNRDSYNCSTSTIHQLVRFLRIAMGDLFTYQEIKYYDGHCHYYNDVFIQSYAPMHLFFVDATTLNDAILHDNNDTTCYWSNSIC